MSTRTSTGNQNRKSTGNQNRTVPKYGIRTKPALPSSPASEPAPQPSPPAQAWTASRAPALFILVQRGTFSLTTARSVILDDFGLGYGGAY